MNKLALIEAAAAKAQVSKAEAAKVIDAALEAAVEAVKKGEGVLTFRQRKLLRLNWVLNSLSN